MYAQALFQRPRDASCSIDVSMIKEGPPTAAFGPLLRTVFEAIFEVFLMCLMGWFLARKGILDKKTQKQLNRINVSLFTPCLLFSKVAFSLNPEKLKELWIIPILFVVVTGASAIVAYVLGRLLRLRRSQRNFGMAASMFNNSNSLPIALMQSLVVTVPGLKWGSDDNKDAMLGRALGYLVLYSTLGMMLRWSYGVHLLAQADEDTNGPSPSSADATLIEPIHAEGALLTEEPETDHAPSTSSSSSQLSTKAGQRSRYGQAPARPDVPAELHAAVTALSSDATPTSTVPRPGLATNGSVGPKRAGSKLKPPVRPQASKRFFSSFPNSPARSPSPSPSSTPTAYRTSFNPGALADAHETARRLAAEAGQRQRSNGFAHSAYTDDELDASDSEWATGRPSASGLPHPASAPSTTKKAVTKVKGGLVRFWKGFTQFMTMPLYAALASFIVALAPPLQHVLSEHVQPVKGFLTSAGNCSIPVTLVVLGAYFYQEPEKDKAKEENTKVPKISTTAPGSNQTPRPMSPPLIDLRDEATRRKYPRTSSSDLEAQPQAPRLVSGASRRTIVSFSDEEDEHSALLSAQRAQLSPSSASATRDASRSPWASATTLAESVRDAFRMRGLHSRTAKPKDEAMPGESRTVFVAVISRMILVPLLMLPFVATGAYFDFHPVFEDPVFVCSTVLLISSPPALTLAQITQAASGDAFERLISRTIFWAYCIFTPPLTLVYVIIALHFSRL